MRARKPGSGARSEYKKGETLIPKGAKPLLFAVLAALSALAQAQSVGKRRGESAWRVGVYRGEYAVYRGPREEKIVSFTRELMLAPDKPASPIAARSAD